MTGSGGTATILSETRTYPGWHELSNGVYQTTGPVQVTREVVSANGANATDYTETLTYSFSGGWPSTSSYVTAGAPNGSELLTNPSVVIQSLSRSIMDSSGQVVEQDDYFNLLTNFTYSGQFCAMGARSTSTSRPPRRLRRRGQPNETIDPLDDVTASYYNGLGEDTADYQGQVITNTSSAYTSAQSPPGPSATSSPIVIVRRAHTSTSTTRLRQLLDQNPNDYEITNGGFPGNDPTTPTSLCANWYFLGTVTVPWAPRPRYR